MKLAIATENGMVSSHFGRCENFTLCEIVDGKVVEKRIISTEGNQHAGLPQYLGRLGVNEVISGGAGSGALENLNGMGIKIMTGVQGAVDDVIEKYVNGQLECREVVCHEHQHQHQHGQGDSCGCGCH